MTTLREHLEAIQHELGVPGEGYPAPVSNAYEHAVAALEILDNADRMGVAHVVRLIPDP